jgi:hypothetical protein
MSSILSSPARVWLAAIVSAATFIVSGGAWAQGQNGTTLAAYKTLDICAVQGASTPTWRYHGDIAVWNTGAIDTYGLSIDDTIQTVIGKSWKGVYSVPIAVSGEIPAGTTQENATVFHYSIDRAPLPNGARNDALVTILNHSSSLGKPKGPEPKFTFTGIVQPCPTVGGCVYTQGYWGNKPDVVWPSPYDRNGVFYLSGMTWQQIMDTPVHGNAYYNLAHQYIAAVLNVANGALVPDGVTQTIALATAWFQANDQSACSVNSACGTQVTWAGVLDSYNNGVYPGGPSHCQ